MTLKTTCTLALTTALLLTAAPLAAAASPPCRSPGKVVAANNVAQLTLSLGTSDRDPFLGYWACSKGHRARYLGEPAVPDDGGITVVPDLAGRFAGASWQRNGKGGCVGSVSSLALDTGRNAGEILDSAICGQTIIDVQVTSRGVLFWSETFADGTAAIKRTDRPRVTTVLDAGPAVDAASLAVTDRRAYWTTNGQARFALP